MIRELLPFMPLKIIPAILIVTLIFPPIPGSSGKPGNTAFEAFSPHESSHQAQAGAIPTQADDWLKPSIQEEMPGVDPVESPPSHEPLPSVETQQPLPEAPLSTPANNVNPPAPEQGGSGQNPGAESAEPLHGAEGTAPPDVPQEECTAEEPSVITDSFPQADLSTVEYTIFKNEVLGIIKKAEQVSGIKTTYGVFVMDLVNNYTCGVNENLTRIDPYDNMLEGYFNSASVVKLFQGYILCDMMRRGELSAEETYYDAVTGRRFKLLNMIKTMISYSDNNYSNASLRLIGNQKSNEVLDRLGIHNSRIYGEMSGAIGYSRKNNLARYGTEKRCARITPRDTGLILYNVYVNRETDIYMKTIHEGLLGNIYNTRIPVGVARVNRKYAVAHKTGTNSQLGIYNDAGIIYCKRPFILVVFTQSTTQKAGENFIRSLAEQLTRYFDGKA